MLKYIIKTSRINYYHRSYACLILTQVQAALLNKVMCPSNKPEEGQILYCTETYGHSRA